MFTVDKIVEMISKKTGKRKSEVRQMIAEKKEELSDLVSEEGAAYIIAREHEISLLRESKRQFKVRHLVSGLSSVDLVVRIVKVFEERAFERNGKPGRVTNILLGDETGAVRMSLWNEEIDMLKARKIAEGDTIKISGGWVKTDNRENLELRLGRGSIEKVDQIVDLPEPDKIQTQFMASRRVSVPDMKEGDSVDVVASLVQVFRKNPFYEVCPECGVRIKQSDGKWVCDDHGTIEPKHALVLSGIIDDGYGSVRAVFFRDNAEIMFGKSTEELLEITKKDTDSLAVFEQVEMLGREKLFSGRVKINQLTENLELIVNTVQDVDVKKETERLISELQK